MQDDEEIELQEEELSTLLLLDFDDDELKLELHEEHETEDCNMKNWNSNMLNRRRNLTWMMMIKTMRKMRVCMKLTSYKHQCLMYK